jgi:nitrate reductase assembly molybdenum cofactor insertion protein NarJ
MHLKLSLYEAPDHAGKVMAKLGITYQHAVPQSLYDNWWFWNCENVPDPLPPYLQVLSIAPHDAIGRGLSKEEADDIVAYAKGWRGPWAKLMRKLYRWMEKS